MGSRNKNLFLVVGPLRVRGGGVKAGPLRKNNFFKALQEGPEKRMTTKLKGVGGGRALVAFAKSIFSLINKPI